VVHFQREGRGAGAEPPKPARSWAYLLGVVGPTWGRGTVGFRDGGSHRGQCT